MQSSICKFGWWELLLLLMLAIVAGAFQPAGAAVPATAKQAQPESYESLLQTIEDDTKRSEFIRNLKLLIAARKAQQTGPDNAVKPVLPAVSFLAGRIDGLSRDVLASSDALLRMPALFAHLSEQLTHQDIMGDWVRALVKLLMALVSAWLLDRLARRLLQRFRQDLESRSVATLAIRILYLCGRTVLEVIPIAVFGVSAYFVLSLLAPGYQAHRVMAALIDAVVLYRILMALARLLLVPAATQLRLTPFSDITANYWFIWCRRVSSLAIYGYFFTTALQILGMPEGLHSVIAKLLGLVLASMLVVLVLQSRAGVARWLSMENDQSPVQGPRPVARRGLHLLRRRLAETWHVLLILYIGAGFFVWTLEIPGGFKFLLRASIISLIIVVFASLLSAGMRRLLDQRFAISEHLHRRFPLLEARANRYLPVLKLIVNTSIWVVAIFGLLQAWGVGVLGWLSSTSGQQLLASVITITIITLAALLAWEVISYLIERAIERARSLGAAEQNARLMTLLPLARRTFLLALVVMVLLMVLAEFGINIAPLLAGAGVIGLAIGFGAQTLVKDVITGLFILIENTITVGDYIDVGGHEGTVESLSIRSVRLRDAAANVHTVPFSDVSSVLNYTRDYSYAVLNIGIAYRENVDEVIDVIEELGEQMLTEPDVAENILEPIQVQGVNALEDSAVVIRARIKVKAGYQWATRRTFNRLMKNRFDELGIEIPFPHQTIYFGVDANGQAPPVQVQMRHEDTASETIHSASPVAAKRLAKTEDLPATKPSGRGKRITDHDVDQGGGVD